MSTSVPTPQAAAAPHATAVAGPTEDPALARERGVLELAERALDWSNAERDARLEALCAGDRALLDDVRALLAEAAQARGSLPTQLAVPVAPEDEPPPPARLGAYRIGELLGRGGMGRVYRGERADGAFEHSVAIKLLRRVHGSGVIEEQFARERQILANLQHPNIARLLDGGTAPDGTAYIVMELLAGEPVTRYVAERELPLATMIDTFLSICDAVAAAHERLVVHADIKPSNVIVDAAGNIKLVDFGVAQVLGAGGSVDPPSAPIGLTIAYSSPARRRGEPASTVDDVYSLGMLLDELLDTYAAREGKGPRASGHGVPDDLRSVAARARAEEVAERYPTVDALIEDLRRWLTGHAVRAHRGDWRYVAGKLLQRHRPAAITAAASLVLLLGAAIALAVLFAQANTARRAAEQRFDDLRELSRYVLFDVYDRLERVPRSLPLRRDLANRARSYLDRLASDPNAPPELKLEVVEGLRRLARVQATPGDASLGEAALARANLARAGELLSSMRAGDPDTRRAVALVGAQLGLLRAAIAHSIDLDIAAAERELAAIREPIDALLAESVAAARANDAGGGSAGAQILGLDRDWSVEQAAVLQWKGEYLAAQRVAAEALGRHAAGFAQAAPGSAASLQQTRLLDVLGESRFYAGDIRGAVAPYREQLAILERAAAAAPQDVGIGRRVARAGWALGSTLIEVGGAAEAEPLLALAHRRYETLVLLDPEDRELQRSLDITANAHAQALSKLRRFREAQEILRRSVARRAQLAAADPTNASLARDLAIARATLGDALAEGGESREACSAFAQASLDFERIRASGRLSNLDRDFGLRRLREQQARYCPR